MDECGLVATEAYALKLLGMSMADRMQYRCVLHSTVISKSLLLSNGNSCIAITGIPSCLCDISTSARPAVETSIANCSMTAFDSANCNASALIFGCVYS